MVAWSRNVERNVNAVEGGGDDELVRYDLSDFCENTLLTTLLVVEALLVDADLVLLLPLFDDTTEGAYPK